MEVHSMWNKKLNADQVSIDTAGNVFKHVIVELRGSQTIAELRESPALWANIQGNATLRLARGDIATIISPDGLAIADQCRVTRSLGGQVWLSAPLRMIALEEVGLFSTDHHEVIPHGVGFSIRAKRSGAVEPKVFASEELAKIDILKKVPTAA